MTDSKIHTADKVYRINQIKIIINVALSLLDVSWNICFYYISAVQIPEEVSVIDQVYVLGQGSM